MPEVKADNNSDGLTRNFSLKVSQAVFGLLNTVAFNL